MTRFFIMLFTILTFWTDRTQADPVVIGPATNGVWLGPHLEILKDTPEGLDLDDLRSGAHDADFFSRPQNVPSLGYFSGHSYWARFTLDNPNTAAIDLLLASRYATIDFITLYWPDADGRYQSLTLGDCVAWSKRPVQARNPVFPITVPPGQHTYYVHMKTSTAVQFSLALWTPRNFLHFEVKESNFLGLLFGVCFVMFFYNLFISIKFNSRAYTAYVTYIFFYTIFVAIYHGVMQQYVFPDMENGWIFKDFIFITIDIISICCATFSIEFLDLKKSAPRLCRLLSVFRVLMAINIVNWLTFELGAKPFTLGCNFFFSVSLMFIGFYRSFSYRPARYYTLGWTIFLTSNLIMLLSNNGFINGTSIGAWAQFTGAVLELVLLSLALGERVALINHERQESLMQQRNLQAQLIESERDKAAVQEALLEEREQHIRSLDRLVYERTRDIQSILATINQGILTIGLRDGTLHIGSEYSHYLSTIVSTPDISDQDPFVLIFGRSQLPSEVIDQMRQVIFSCIGDPDLSYEVNSDLLIRDVILHQDDGTTLYLEIDWLPVLGHENRIDKMLVILRDVTQLRILREQARSQEKELLITGELTTRKGRKFPQFHQRTRREIEDISKKAASIDRQSILRFLHTLKGDARVYELRTLTQCIHEAESTVLSLDVMSPRDVLGVMTIILNLLQLYDEIWRVRLGFQQDLTDRPSIPEDLSTRLFHFLEDVMQGGPQSLQEPSKQLYQQWNEVLACSLEAVLHDPVQNLKDLARDLKKAVPLVVFQGRTWAIPQEFHARLSQAFGHILANSMDHGIEARDERLRKGKNEYGTIFFTQEYSAGSLRVTYRDDGRGLNVGALRAKAKNRDATLQELAEMIFQSGLSTSQETSLISGRGIGMEAVRELLESLGGSIMIDVGEPHKENPDFHDFALIINFPLRENGTTFNEKSA
ncbi:7TM diverse intracellular signaling domain-containing protein [Oligoflexus tunisiensis]|uniref:7TM diverse intracellular signaling domain-containing protein n=1 Tax=Oligoflexus tunisiensis TaxID=708132 RepID=UPI00114CB91B|nr:7TM diverse intracellular signaling domain-containing protein [Oligoflexus tunisiensis]